jgi:hypothetical protein
MIGHAVDEVLHAAARVNTLDNISAVMIAFEPLITLVDSVRASNQYSQEAQGQQAMAEHHMMSR